ncbi:MAG: class I SAM-dependent methyltransferase [Patescibacteria group bacterium]
MESKWTSFDKMLRRFRIRKIERFVREGSVLCDLGCGREAFLLKHFSRKIKHGYGFDKYITAEEGGAYTLKALELDDKVPLPDATVDLVTILAALEHFSDEAGMLSEVYRVLKPGGRVVITVPTWRNKPLLEMLASWGVINKDEILDHKRYYSKKELSAALTKAGFSPASQTLTYWQFGLNLFGEARKDL